MPYGNQDFITKNLKEASLKGKRFGAPKRLLTDTLYAKALEVLKLQGAEIVEIEEEKLELPNFIRLLNLDMKKDLPAYMENYANENITLRTVSDVMEFNLKDSLKTMPYGQGLFKGISEDNGDAEYLKRIKDTLKINGLQYFNNPTNKERLHVIKSILTGSAVLLVTLCTMAAAPAVALAVGSSVVVLAVAA